MQDHKSLIRKLEKQLPELASSKDLVRVGMYRTEQAAYAARQSGKCPPYLRIPSAGIRYPRQGIIQFLSAKFHESDSITNQKPTINSQCPSDAQK